MKCSKCNGEIETGQAHFREYGSYFHSVCPEGAERSEAAPRCPPSATGCPDARAVGQVGADSSGRCPENSGPWAALLKDLSDEIQDAKMRVVSKGGHGFDRYADGLLKAYETALIHAKYHTPKPTDAPQRSGERALPGNADLRHSAGNAASQPKETTDEK